MLVQWLRHQDQRRVVVGAPLIPTIYLGTFGDSTDWCWESHPHVVDMVHTLQFVYKEYTVSRRHLEST